MYLFKEDVIILASSANQTHYAPPPPHTHRGRALLTSDCFLNTFILVVYEKVIAGETINQTTDSRANDEPADVRQSRYIVPLMMPIVCLLALNKAVLSLDMVGGGGVGSSH